MAKSRYDDIKYFDDGEFKVPQEVKVYDGNEFISLGTKDSFNTNKLCAFDGENMFCATYRRNDVDIPGTVQIGKDKYLNVQKKVNGEWKKCAVDSYHGDYRFEMRLSVTSSTPLYTFFSKDNGDVTEYSYTNYIAKVNSSGKVAIYVGSKFYGKSINTGKYVEVTGNKTSSYCINKGENFKVVMTRSSNSGKLSVKIYDKNNTQKDSFELNDATLWVENPNHHYIGVETLDGTGKNKTYGNAKISYVSFTPTSSRGTKFTVNFENLANGATTMSATGGYNGRLEAKGTKVVKSKYTEYIKQTI